MGGAVASVAGDVTFQITMPRNYRFYTADVFTDTMFGGNQLAVFTDARGIDPATMQRIAREMNLSETVFVLPAETADGTRRVRIFTPDRELPFAGHPTVGTAFILASIGDVPRAGDRTRIVLEEGVGPVEVMIQFRGEAPEFCQLAVAKMPEELPLPGASADFATILSLDPAEIGEGDRRPRCFSCGVPYLFVTVPDLGALARARPRLDLWQQQLAGYPAAEIYVITERAAAGSLCARMFAPSFGISEDPATGSAAAALAGYLCPDDVADALLRWTVRQGVDMGRASTLEVEADVRNGAIAAVRVGGSSVMVSEGVMTLPAA